MPTIRRINQFAPRVANLGNRVAQLLGARKINRRLTVGVLSGVIVASAGISIGLSTTGAEHGTPASGAVTAAAAGRQAVNHAANRSMTRTAPKAAVKHAVKPRAKAKPRPRVVTMPRVRGLSYAQNRNAATIVAVGRRMGVSQRGQIIAIATALQESNLLNLRSAVDHDSLGLFQQRPSSGWGSPGQLVTPSYAAAKFYQSLLQYKSLWGCLTCAAQRVQVSAFPSAYAKHEGFATFIVRTLNRH